MCVCPMLTTTVTPESISREKQPLLKALTLLRFAVLSEKYEPLENLTATPLLCRLEVI